MESRIDYTYRSCLESMSNLWKEPCEVIKLVYVGFLLFRVWDAIPMKQPVDSLIGNQERNWFLVIHRIKTIRFRCLQGIWWRDNTWGKFCCFSKTSKLHDELGNLTLGIYSCSKYFPFLFGDNGSREWSWSFGVGIEKKIIPKAWIQE